MDDLVKRLQKQKLKAERRIHSSVTFAKVHGQAVAARLAGHCASAIQRAREEITVGQRVQMAINPVMQSLRRHLKDPEMLKHVLAVILSFMHQKLSKRLFEPFILSLLAEHLRAVKKLDVGFCKAVADLTNPEDISDINLENPFDRLSLFEAMSKTRHEVTGGSGDSGNFRTKSMHESKRKRHMRRQQVDTLTEPAGKGLFLEARSKMLSFLEPCFALLERCPAHFKSQNGLTNADVLAVQHKVAMAAMALKVHDPSHAGTPLRVAFTGVEGVGKSSLISHLTSGGCGESFLPVGSAGMRTMCICSHGEHELISIVEREMLRKVEQFSTADLRNLTSGPLDVLRVEKPFNPPFPVEFLDVPGIKEDTQQATSLALGICAVLVVCLGQLDIARTGFERGSGLSLLVQLWAGMAEKVPILGVVTKGKWEDYHEQGYLELLRDKFHGVEVKVVFANFSDIHMAQKAKQAERFYQTLRHYKPAAPDPFKLFADLETDIGPVLRRVWKGIQEAATPEFLSQLDQVKDNCMQQLNDGLKQCTTEDVKNSLLCLPIEKAEQFQATDIWPRLAF